MNIPSEPILRRKLSDEVFARLKLLIENGELKAGDEMPSERELMERFGVGRPAIREQRLHQHPEDVGLLLHVLPALLVIHDLGEVGDHAVRVDAAVLDVDLNGEKSYPVADALALRDIRFIFATGYGLDAVAEGYRHYPRCQKPFDHQAILKALTG